MHIPLIKQELLIPSGVSVSVAGHSLHVKGPKGEDARVVGTKRVQLATAEGKVIMSCANATKTDKRTLNTNAAHVKNMLRGAASGHVYKLKICSGHFPMSVEAKGDMFIVKNFIGESVPRTLKLRSGVKVTISGTEITVESHKKEWAGSQASAIELLMRRPGFDTRVFQDGIYIVEKDGKKV